MKQVRQGDIVLDPVPDPFVRMRKVELDNGRMIVAYGEASGHHHALIGDAEIRRDPSTGDLVISVGPEGAKFVHEEHGEIPLEEGRYVVVNQREYEEPAMAGVGGSRRVAD